MRRRVSDIKNTMSCRALSRCVATPGNTCTAGSTTATRHRPCSRPLGPSRTLPTGPLRRNIKATQEVTLDSRSPRTAAERYFRDRMADPEYAKAYQESRRAIDASDSLVRNLDERRIELGLSKADLARRASMRPESVRRILSSRTTNPTMATVSALASALDLEVALVDREPDHSKTTRRSRNSATRRRTVA